VSNLTVPHSDYNSLMCIQALKQWQLFWNTETQKKVHATESRANVIDLFRLPRQVEIIIFRLSIGHRYLTYGHLLRCEIQRLVGDARDDIFCVAVTSLSELFSNFAASSIIDFIEETGFCSKI